MKRKTVLWIYLCLLLIIGETFCEQLKDGSPAAFKSVPTTVKTFENDTVTLPCHLENAGTDYSVRWLKDKVIIADSSPTSDIIPPFRYKFYSNHSLHVTRLVPSDTGEYICEVIREKPWSPLRQTHAIEVLHPPGVTMIPEIGYLEVKLNDDVDIMCEVSGVPKPYIKWVSKGKAIDLIDNRPRLKFKVTNRQVAGTFECIADNGVGEPARASIQVVVIHPPDLITDTPWVHTSIGLRGILDCQVYATPSAKIQWFHDGKPVQIGSRIVAHSVGNKYNLIFRNVMISDFGQYTCRAENKIGMSEIKMQMSGVAHIAVFKKDNVQNRQTSSTFTLIWEVDSLSPIIEYSLWFRPYKPRQQQDGVFIKDKDDTWKKLNIPGEINNYGPLHSATYTLRGLAPSTVYEAMITSRNRFGWSKPSEVLHLATTSIGAVMEVKSTDESDFTPVIEDVADFKTASNIFSTAMSPSTKKESGTSSARSIETSCLVLVLSCLFIYNSAAL